MAFTDATPRTILQGFLPFKVVLSEAVPNVGDMITFNGGWVLAVAATATRVYVAGEPGAIGDEITAYVGAVLDGATGGLGGEVIGLAAAGAFDAAGAKKVGESIDATTFWVGPTVVPPAA